MLELVFVIVIMGIIGKFGVEFLAQAYKSFIFSNVNNNLQSTSETAVEFIASRLQNRIKDSVIARKSDGSFDALSSIDASNASDYTVLEWIGVDEDGFRGNSDTNTSANLPNWSGIIDLDEGNASVLVSPATNTDKVNALISILSNNNSDINDSAIFFIGANSDIKNGYGWDGNTSTIYAQKGAMHPINSVANQPTYFTSAAVTGTDFSGIDIYEYYKLAWSAYAIVYEAGTNNMGTLKLYYDYQPWHGESYTTAKSSILMENVSTFQFMAIGSIIKIQVCTKTNLVEEYSLCKEKTIF
jgi:hypothetical protein